MTNEKRTVANMRSYAIAFVMVFANVHKIGRSQKNKYLSKNQSQFTNH